MSVTSGDKNERITIKVYQIEKVLCVSSFCSYSDRKEARNALQSLTIYDGAYM
ncbi:MAG: hypothetical protein K0Q53_108 [Massilibacillus sp.]|jgi:hypothetical protein|nr:hypothetical protein [Massilibacillus sp.]